MYAINRATTTHQSHPWKHSKKQRCQSQSSLLNIHSSCPKTPSQRLQVALTVCTKGIRPLCSSLCLRAQSLSRVWLVIPRTVARQAPLSMEFLRKEYWSRLPLPSPGDLPDPSIESTSLASLAWAREFFTTASPGKVREKEKLSHFLPTSQEAFSHLLWECAHSWRPCSRPPSALQTCPGGGQASGPLPPLHSGLTVPPPLLCLQTPGGAQGAHSEGRLSLSNLKTRNSGDFSGALRGGERKVSVTWLGISFSKGH